MKTKRNAIRFAALGVGLVLAVGARVGVSFASADAAGGSMSATAHQNVTSPGTTVQRDVAPAQAQVAPAGQGQSAGVPAARPQQGAGGQQQAQSPNAVQLLLQGALSGLSAPLDGGQMRQGMSQQLAQQAATQQATQPTGEQQAGGDPMGQQMGQPQGQLVTQPATGEQGATQRPGNQMPTAQQPTAQGQGNAPAAPGTLDLSKIGLDGSNGLLGLGG